ncbi:MAG: hypothetical protein PHE83_02310 [Opitutaceae bacterium]|nr:hypothetical protein [Opitutaceae bacterium]
MVQLAVGCSWEACLGFALTLFFGWCACEAATPWRSLLGLLTISLYGKTVLFGCVAKTLLLQPMDIGLHAPAETGAVFALGFAGVWLAVLLLRLLPLPARPLLRSPASPRSWLVLWLAFLLLGGAGWFFSFHGNIDIVIKSEADVAAASGRTFEAANMFALFLPFAPAAAVFYLSARGNKRLISHPLVIVSVLLGAIPGILEARKSPILMPFAAVWLSVLLLRGLWYKPLWSWTVACLMMLMIIVYPFVEFGRFAIERGRIGERVDVIKEVAGMFLSGASYKEMYAGAVETDLAVMQTPYMPKVAASLDRFVRYFDASRLVDATLTSGRYTGFYTIEWGLRQIPPRSLSPDKPLGFVNNWLTRYTGDTVETDERTQMAYGFMASFFNAFGYGGAFVGSFLLFGGMIYWVRLFGESRTGPTIWMIVMFFLFDTSLAEDSAGAMLPRVWLPVTLFLYSIAVHLFSSRILGGLMRSVGAVSERGRDLSPNGPGKPSSSVAVNDLPS